MAIEAHDQKRLLIVTLREDGSGSDYEFEVRRLLMDGDKEVAPPQIMRAPATKEEADAILGAGVAALNADHAALNQKLQDERDAAAAEKKALEGASAAALAAAEQARTEQIAALTAEHEARIAEFTTARAEARTAVQAALQRLADS